MENIKTVKIDSLFESVEHIIIEHEDGSTTSMPKTIYDEIIAAQKDTTNY